MTAQVLGGIHAVDTPTRKPRCRYLRKTGRNGGMSGLEYTRCTAESVGDETIQLCQHHLAAALHYLARVGAAVPAL